LGQRRVSDWLPWVVAGLALIGLEIFAPGAFMMWIGLGALGAGVVTWFSGVEFATQVMLFAGFSAVSTLIGLKLRRSSKRLNTMTAGLVGRPASALVFAGSEGRVRLGDSEWGARVPEGVAPPEFGAALRVVDVDGTTLIVRPIPPPA
jgi:membrane protein implicated in regulation of membrane protease activity